MTILRGAVIGCGTVSEFHLRAWQRVPEVVITALCDSEPTRAEAQARKFATGGKVYSTAESLLECESLDFVDILSPPDRHKEHCLLARTAGLHVICQKPLCSELADAAEVVEAFDDYPKYLVVHENHRYRPWFRRIGELHKAGFFGGIRYLRLQQHDAHEPPEEYKRQADRGVMLEYGVHLVDMMRALVGEPNRVQASFSRLNPRVRGESLAVAIYACSGATAVLDVAWKSAPPEGGGLIVEGQRGTAIYEGPMTRGPQARFRLYQDGNTVLDEHRRPLDDYVESFYLLQRGFVDSLLANSPPPQPATDNLRTLRSTFAAYDSAASHKTVALRS
jgi:predicted dehydrogenase